MFSVLFKLGWFFKDQWKRYTIAVICMLISSITELIPPMLIGTSIDEIATGTLTWRSLTTTLVLIASITIITYIVNYVGIYRLFGGAVLVERILRSRFLRHLLKMTPSFYERNRTGDLMARATNDLNAVSMTAGFGIMTMIDSTLWMAAIIVAMSAFISWKLTLAAILPLPVLAYLANMYGNWIHNRFTEAQDAFGKMNDDVLETVSGIRVIRAYVQEKSSERKFAEVTEDVFNKNLAVVRIDSLFEPTVKILVGISYLIGLCYGAYLVYHGEITIGVLVTFNVYLGYLIWPMFAIGEMINVLQRGNASMDRVNETLFTKEDVKEPAEPVDVKEPDQSRRRHLLDRARPDHRHRRAHRQRQDDADQATAARISAGQRLDHDLRRADRPDQLRPAQELVRIRAAAAIPVLEAAQGQHQVRQSRGNGGGAGHRAGVVRAGEGPGLPAARAGYARRREGGGPVRRTEATGIHRPGAHRGSADPHPRRCAVSG